ncbi:hypothetical protein RhiirB3_449386 [Rhizophagus irregularis]|nr:hypothetical protein RhiirB3_449386 [Rhizophagus irregularis]
MRNGIKTKIDQLLSQNQELIKSGSHMNPMNNFWHYVQLQDPDLHQDKRIVDIKRVNYEIQLGDEKSTDGEEIKCRFNELWDNIISAIYLGQMVLAH